VTTSESSIIKDLHNCVRSTRRGPHFVHVAQRGGYDDTRTYLFSDKEICRVDEGLKTFFITGRDDGQAENAKVVAEVYRKILVKAGYRETDKDWRRRYKLHYQFIFPCLVGKKTQKGGYIIMPFDVRYGPARKGDTISVGAFGGAKANITKVQDLGVYLVGGVACQT